MIKRDSWGHSYFIVRVGMSTRDQRVLLMTSLGPYGKPKFLGSGGSMVAKLKLKGIDGRAPPGVEPSA